MMNVNNRIRETDLLIPTLRLAAARPNRHIPTAELIVELTEMFEPEGDDAELLEGRNDTRFSQIVRNLVSHRESKTSMFNRGYAEYSNDGVRITEAGLAFLANQPD
jgi:hypothetical protein